MVFQPIIHQHRYVLIVLLCGVIKTLYDIYSLMLVGRVERIFTRVGGTQLQSLAHPPQGEGLGQRAMMRCNVDMIILYI